MRAKTCLPYLGFVLLFTAATAAAQINPFARSGFALTTEDGALLAEAVNKHLNNDDVEDGAIENWSNEKSGNKGTVTMIRKFNYKNHPCRRLQHDIKLAKNADPFRFIIDRCKAPNGEWKIL